MAGTILVVALCPCMTLSLRYKNQIQEKRSSLNSPDTWKDAENVQKCCHIKRNALQDVCMHGRKTNVEIFTTLDEFYFTTSEKFFLEVLFRISSMTNSFK
jgi:hypothetical protein